MDYPPGDTTNMVIKPGDGDLHGNKVPLPKGSGFFFWQERPPPGPVVAVPLLLSEVQINCEHHSANTVDHASDASLATSFS